MSYTKAEYHRLVEEVLRHDKHYFSQARPTISDYEYDQLVNTLREIEQLHPDWCLSDSPTLRVGSL